MTMSYTAFRGHLLRRAVEVWGSEPQWRQIQEECAELIVAINHFRRGREGARQSLIGEIADVEIMLQQARLMLGDDAAIDAMIEIKLNRLSARLERGENK